MEESDYRNKNRDRLISEEARYLLIIASLPLIDGFFLAFLSTKMWQDPFNTITFGLTAFSGAGSVIAAMQLQGKWYLRLAQIIKVYIFIGISAFVITIASPTLIALLPLNFHLFTGLFLLGLGLTVTGVPFLKRIAQWSHFDAAIKIILITSVIHGFATGVSISFAFDTAIILPLVLAVFSGSILTLVGMFLGLAKGKFDQKSINLGAGISLTIMGISMFDVPIPSVIVILPLILGFSWTVFVSVALELQKRISPTTKPPQNHRSTLQKNTQSS